MQLPFRMKVDVGQHQYNPLSIIGVIQRFVNLYRLALWSKCHGVFMCYG